MACAKPENVEYRNRLKFGTQIQYTADDVSIDDVMGDNFFHTIAHRYIQAGDEISINVITKGSIEHPIKWDKAIFEVVSVTPKETKVEIVSEWRAGGKRPGRRLKVA